MSTAEVEKQRREVSSGLGDLKTLVAQLPADSYKQALAALKARKAAHTHAARGHSPSTSSTSTPTSAGLTFRADPSSSPGLVSPDGASAGGGTGARVLVPSSSPTRTPLPPHSSKYFGSAPSPAPAGAGAPRSGQMGMAIPSSNLGPRPGMNGNGNGSGSGSGGRFQSGSPSDIMSSLRNGVKSTAPTSPTKPSASGSSPSLSDVSPVQPPAAAARPRYRTQNQNRFPDPDDSPARPLVAEVPSSPITPAVTPFERKVTRFRNQFSAVSEDRVRELVRKFGDNYGQICEVLKMEHARAGHGAGSSAPAAAVPGVGVPTATKPKLAKSASFRSDSSFDGTPQQSRTAPVTSSARPPASVPVPAPAPRVAPRRKNENSAIYANRRSRKRDPDESSEDEAAVSDAQDAASDAESAMSWSDEDGPSRKRRRAEEEDESELAALKAFNEDTVEVLTGTISCSVEQAGTIIKLRPYGSIVEARTKLTKAKGVSPKLFEQYAEIMKGYVEIDACLAACEQIASDISSYVTVWRGAAAMDGDGAEASVVGTPRADGLNDVKVDVNKVSELLRNETDARKRKVLAAYVREQPKLLSEGTRLKDYQLLGMNWLALLYRRRIGCILADEMGLGKTIQVIAFIAHLQSVGVRGPHMIFVPASTLENWTREFKRFAPRIDVVTYYGSQAERVGLRDEIRRLHARKKLEVVLASYTQVGSQDDLSFFRKRVEFETCIYDEGHKLKSCTTKAYADLMSIKPKWRLLLTGTPLQNNLQELVSLLMFIKRDIFADAEPYLRAIFKSQGHASLLSQQRVSRARTMLAPFVLRRRKANVLSLPPKTERVQECDMTKTQARLYRETLQRSRKVLGELSDEALQAAAAGADDEEGLANATRSKQTKKNVPRSAGSGSNILMELRKAASHPLLFRKKYTDAVVRKIAKECLNTPRWCDSGFEYIVEDLEVMSDAEIHRFCVNAEYDQIRKFALDPEAFLEGGKVMELRRIMERCKEEGKRILLFSQFVMILDILQEALNHLDVRYVRLDGQTRTDERQAIVDEFNDDEDISIFLLSTKAGGVGINLTAASVVVIYDQDFNPHNDKQAADRAYRIGQEREVEVIKLVTKGSIDEDMLSIGVTKLQLDDAVGGEGGEDDRMAKEVKKSLLTTLRNKFEGGATKAGGPGGPGGEVKRGTSAGLDDDVDGGEGEGVKVEVDLGDGVRKARGSVREL